MYHPKERFPENIFKKVSKDTGLTRKQICGTSREMKFVRARILFMWYALAEDISLAAVGRLLKKDHTTMVYHRKALTTPAITWVPIIIERAQKKGQVGFLAAARKFMTKLMLEQKAWSNNVEYIISEDRGGLGYRLRVQTKMGLIVMSPMSVTIYHDDRKTYQVSLVDLRGKEYATFLNHIQKLPD